MKEVLKFKRFGLIMNLSLPQLATITNSAKPTLVNYFTLITCLANAANMDKFVRIAKFSYSDARLRTRLNHFFVLFFHI